MFASSSAAFFNSSSSFSIACSASPSLSIAFCWACGEFSPAARSAPASAMDAIASARAAAASEIPSSSALAAASPVFASSSACSADFSWSSESFCAFSASAVASLRDSSASLISFTWSKRFSIDLILSLGISATASDSVIFSISASLASASFSRAALSRGRAFSRRSATDLFSFNASRASCISGVDCSIASEA